MLHWLEQEKIHVSDIDFILDRMSEQQVCNYLQRQKSGTRDSLRQIIFTWRDYLSMADKLGINTHDEIVYRVKLLRQRHDELVEQLRNTNTPARCIPSSFRQVYAILCARAMRFPTVSASQTAIGSASSSRRHISCSCARPQRSTSRTTPLRWSQTARYGRNGQNDDLKDAEMFLKEWQKVVSERLTESDREKAEKSKILRLQEFEQLRQDDVRIHVGDLAGQRLVDVLVSDLMETAA